MKNTIYTFIALIFFACDSEKANDCIQTSGPLLQKEFVVDTFEKILVNRNIELILKAGPQQKVVIETGKNLMNDIVVSVQDGRIALSDNNICNYVRDYKITKAYITSPNITEIRSSTQYDILSDGVLTFPSISIFSEDFNAPGTYTVGDFVLQIDNNNFTALSNGLSILYISGHTNNLNINFASGDSRFEGRDLKAQKVTIFHRGSNDIIVNPIEELNGKLVSTGSVISVSRPPIITIEALYKGRLIFE